MPVRVPDGDIVATVIGATLKSPPIVVDDNVVVPPQFIDVMPVKGVGITLTVMTMVV